MLKDQQSNNKNELSKNLKFLVILYLDLWPPGCRYINSFLLRLTPFTIVYKLIHFWSPNSYITLLKTKV